MLRIKNALLLWVVVIISAGCSHPIEITGEGDVTSASGNRDCTLELFQASDPKCTKNYAIGAYSETYTATARPGWLFRGWKTYCGHKPTLPNCTFNQPAGKVFQNWGNTLWPLRAEFVLDCVGPGCIETFPPVLGAVTDTTIKIFQATGSDTTWKVRYRIVAGAWSEQSVAINAASGLVGNIELTGLTADTLYEYEVQLDNTVYYTSTFSTLPAAGFAGQLRFGLGTDFAHFEAPFLALGDAATKNLDFMLMIGDLMYADHNPQVGNTAAAYANRYWLTWNETNFGALSSTTPMFMMWDDHEIENDFWPGKSLPDRYPAAKAAYDLMVNGHNPDTTGGLLYYSFSVPGADFFVLDTRSYRSPGTDIDDINKTMLGDVQRNALLDYLELTSTAPFKFIVTSVPFSLGEDADDTWTAYRTERDLIMSEIEMRGISNVAFLSGDRHWSGIFRIISPGGYVYYDFLPSPTGTEQRPAPVGNAHPGEEEIVYITDAFKMWGEFEIDLSGPTPTLAAAFVDENGNDQCVITIGNDETGVLAGPALAACAP